MEGKRKLIAFILGLACIIVLASMASIKGEAVVSCIWAICLMFGGGNVGEHFAKTRRPPL